MSGLDVIVEYVEGRISPAAFCDFLYTSKELEILLSEEIRIAPYTNGGSVYLYLISADFLDPGDRLNCQTLLEKFLDVKKIRYSKNDGPKETYSLLLKAQPHWLNIPDFYLKKMFDLAPKVDPQGLTAFIKKEIAEKFVYLTKPPRWLQSPSWMFTDGRPLMFIGQMNIGAIRHDDAQLYIFYDRKNGIFHTLEQTA